MSAEHSAELSVLEAPKPEISHFRKLYACSEDGEIVPTVVPKAPSELALEAIEQDVIKPDYFLSLAARLRRPVRANINGVAKEALAGAGIDSDGLDRLEQMFALTSSYPQGRAALRNGKLKVLDLIRIHSKETPVSATGHLDGL